MSLAMKTARAASQGGMAGTVGFGDPGLGSFFKGLIKTGVSFITGGPVSAAKTAGGLLVGPRGTVPPPVMPGRPQMQQIPTLGPVSQTAGFGRTITRNGGGCEGGFHPNKSNYFLVDGTFVPEGSRCVKNRRRNPLNPRAASRAISRIVSAKKATKMLGRITVRSNIPHHHHRRAAKK